LQKLASVIGDPFSSILNVLLVFAIVAAGRKRKPEVKISSLWSCTARKGEALKTVNLDIQNYCLDPVAANRELFAWFV